MINKISFKIIFSATVAIIIIIGAFAFFNVRFLERTLVSEIKRHASQQSETIKSSVRSAMLANNRSDISAIIKTIGKQQCIQEVRILNKEGEINYASDSSKIGEMLDKKAEACYNCHATGVPLEKLDMKDRTRIFRLHPDSARTFGVINPIYNEPSCWNSSCHVHPREQKVLGVLDLTVCLKTMDDELQNAKISMVVFALFAIGLLGFVLWIVVHLWVDKPVKKLVQATREVASGNLNYTIGHLNNDELGALARSFDNMTRKTAEARQQLFQSDKMASLGRLAAGVAHEINNPLTGILTYSSFLLKRAKSQPELKNDLEVIVHETKRSREIVKGLLDFARQSVPKKNKANIRNIIERAASVVEHQLNISKVTLEKELAPDLPQVLIDANQMQQVFTNLIVNASHAMCAGGGSIRISTKLISLKPYGTAQIKQALCPKGHNLMDPDVKIRGMASIKLRAKSGGSEGFIHLDPIYGKNRHKYGILIDDKAEIELSCPKCQTSLIDSRKRCPQCGAPVYFIEIPGKGRIEGCVTKGGEWQHWKIKEEEGAKEYIEIKTADTGCGIPPENLNKIFEPFFTTKGQKGTGLGLSVIWGIIDNHGGSIHVESEINVGTVFTIHLPVDDSDTE